MRGLRSPRARGCAVSLDVTLSCPKCTGCDEHAAHELYSANITHNLAPMAREAGLYDVVWRPEEHGIETAAQLIEPLRAGIARLVADPEHFAQWNPSNKWGSYDRLLSFLGDYLRACERHPDARVGADR